MLLTGANLGMIDIPFVTDGSVPADEVHFRNNRGETVGRIVGLRHPNIDLRWALSDLDWALQTMEEWRGCENDGTPNHECEFRTRPDKGSCNFHERYWTARELLSEAGIRPLDEKDSSD